MLYEEDAILNSYLKKSLQLNSEEISLYNQGIRAENSREQNIVHSNSIDVMSNCFFLMKIIDFDLIKEDSFILNLIMRLLRKNVQLLTNEYLSNIQYKNNLINLKEFSLTFKVRPYLF